jgi:hypothetical protein
MVNRRIEKEVLNNKVSFKEVQNKENLLQQQIQVKFNLIIVFGGLHREKYFDKNISNSFVYYKICVFYIFNCCRQLFARYYLND